MRTLFVLAIFGESMKYTKAALPVLLSSLLFMSAVYADDHLGHHHRGPNAHAHAPIGVMGDHVHKAGDWMFSYRFMTMEMEGNQSGTSNISPEEIVTTITNPFNGPPTLRVVPTKMTMDMHMLGAMYAPSDKFTLMVMTNYIEREMDHITFRGPVGTTRLGTFTTKSKGFGDTKVSGLINIFSNNKHKVHLNLGVSLPTGSITKKDRVLTPIPNMPKMEARLPYAMQLGSGTYDLLPGITWQMYEGRWNVGAQYMATIRTGENDEDYTLGDEHKVTSWASYAWQRGLSTSIRLAYQDVDNIDGQDPRITAPIQTANPDNYGLERLDLFAGLNWVSHSGHRLALEVGTPVYQDLDGPQMETDWILTAGYQFAF